VTTPLWEQVRRATTAFRTDLCIMDPDTGEALTFEEAALLFSGVSEALVEHGFVAQERLAILMKNSVTFLAIEGACSAIGVTVVPINFYSSVKEIAHHVRHSGATALVFDLADDDLPRLEEVRELLSETAFLVVDTASSGAAPAWAAPLRISSAGVVSTGMKNLLPDEAIHRIMYTSATTGEAKGVLIPYGNWVANTVATGSHQLRDVGVGDRYLAATPFTHMSIGYFWTFHSLGGATVSYRKHSPAHFTDVVVEQGITHTLLVPTMIIDLVKHLRANPDDAARLRKSRLRAIWYAGSPMPAAVVAEAEELLGPIFNQQYGLTEMFSVSLTMCGTMLRAEEHAARPGSCGRALAGTSVRVVDEEGEEILAPDTPGELLVQLTGILGGYLDNPVANEETFGGGWLHTGDIATIDPDGYVSIVDRKKDMIISGGFNIYSAEVEGALQSHEAVSACAVVGRPDPTWVEVPVAFVVLNAAASASEADLIAHARARLAHFKAPKAVHFVDELPKNAIGKVAKRELRDQLVATAG
jgi:fatty-acyl-CoA synthase